MINAINGIVLPLFKGLFYTLLVEIAVMSAPPLKGGTSKPTEGGSYLKLASSISELGSKIFI